MNSYIGTALTNYHDRISLFARRLYRMDFCDKNEPSIRKILSEELDSLGYDSIIEDDIGNLIGVLKGDRSGGDILLLSTMKYPTFSGDDDNPGSKSLGTRAGIVSGSITGALLRHSGICLGGDIIFCCIPPSASAGIGIKHLFDSYLADRDIRLVILCEPTNCNLYIGNRGKIEYEIVVKFNSHAADAPTGTSALAPLVERLRAIGNTLPHDTDLGHSSIYIKDALWNYGLNGNSLDLHLIIERTYLPGEIPRIILSRAQAITEAIYRKCRILGISTSMITKQVKTKNGRSFFYEDEQHPWKLPVSSPFVRSSLEVLNKNGIRSAVGCWQNTITNGSYTYGIRKIPTIGFGAGSESGVDSVRYRPPYFTELLSSINGMALIISRQFGNMI